MLEFWMKALTYIAAKLQYKTQKDVEQKEVTVAIEEERTRVAKTLLGQSQKRKAKVTKISQAIIDDDEEQ